MTYAKYKIKRCLALFLYCSGAMDHLLKKRLANKCTVLMYHRILPKELIYTSPSHPAITLSVETFRKQMELIAKIFNPVTINKVLQKYKDKQPFENRSILITFDDGWKDNLYHALPILSENNLSALIFLSTEYINTSKMFWQEIMVSYLLEASMHEGFEWQNLQKILPNSDFSSFKRLDTKSKKEKLYHMTQSFKNLDSDRIKDILEIMKNVILSQTKEPNGTKNQRHFLNWQEALTMLNKEISFGSHGVHHHILTKPNVDVEFELNSSKKLIEKKLKMNVATFSYPNGDYNPTVLAKTEKAGYSLGFGTEFGYNDLNSNPYSLKRINVNEAASDTIPMFLGRILGLW